MVVFVFIVAKVAEFAAVMQYAVAGRTPRMVQFEPVQFELVTETLLQFGNIRKVQVLQHRDYVDREVAALKVGLQRVPEGALGGKGTADRKFIRGVEDVRVERESLNVVVVPMAIKADLCLVFSKLYRPESAAGVEKDLEVAEVQLVARGIAAIADGVVTATWDGPATSVDTQSHVGSPALGVSITGTSRYGIVLSSIPATIYSATGQWGGVGTHRHAA